MPTACAFAIAAITPAILWPLIAPGSFRDVGEILATIVVGFMFSAMAILVLAVPLFLVLKRFAVVNLWTTLASGIAIGTVATTVTPFDLLGNCVLGLAAALSFWLTRRLFEQRALSEWLSRS